MTEPESMQRRPISYQRSPDHRTIVGDLFNTRIGPGSCSIICIKIRNAAETEGAEQIAEEMAEIAVSWGVLKMLAMNIMSLVNAIELERGPIQIPKSVLTIDYTERHREAIRGLDLVAEYAGFRKTGKI